MPSRNPGRPKPSKPFKDLELKQWKTPGTYGEGGGLYFQVRRTEKGVIVKSWIFRYHDLVTKKLRNMGIGSYSDIELKLAREIAKDQRALLRKCKDPLDSRIQEKAEMIAHLKKKKTFTEAAEEFWGFKKDSWSEKHGTNWLNGMKNHAYPILGEMQITTIQRDDIFNVLRPIWGPHNETATRLRERMEAVFAYAKGEGWIKGENPAVLTENMKIKLGEADEDEQPRPSLPFAQIGGFVKSLRTQHGWAAKALEFTILTAARTGETIGAPWKEFDLDQAVWTVPGSRMKARREHTVPLSPRALEILRALPEGGPNDFVFPGTKPGKALSNMAMATVVKRMDAKRRKTEGIGWEDGKGEKIVVHGFRATFKTWAASISGHEREAIEFALAHSIPIKHEAVYMRSEMIEKRIPLMNDWAEVCGELAPPAVNIRSIRSAV